MKEEDRSGGDQVELGSSPSELLSEFCRGCEIRSVGI